MANETDVRKEALEMGWIPPERYKGDPDKFIEAEDFVERGKNFLPILKKNNEKLMTQMGEIRGELNQTKAALNDAIGALQEFKKFHEESSKQAFERARKSLLSQKRDALKEEDFDKVVQIEDTIHQIDQQMSDAVKKEEGRKAAEGKKAEEVKIDPVMQHWMTENSWYGADQSKTAYANAIAPKLRADNPTVVGLEFLNLLTDEVEDKFGGGQKRMNGKGKKEEEEEDGESGGSAHSKVSGGRQASGGGGRRGNKLTYGDLDVEAKKICDRYATQLVGPNKAYKSEDEWRAAYCASLEGGV